jgi:cell division protein FtsI (penicillin-binding protein 3)
MHGGSRAHGQVNLEKLIEKSCNIGAATLALKLGRERYGHYVKLLGFGQKTGIELAAESPGQVSPPETWKDIQVANIAFGQGISVTPLQLLRAYCVVANGGYLVRPHLLMSTDPQKDAGERVLSDTTSRQMRQMFFQVVESGTGKAASIPGYMVAGKTGTAQKPTPEHGYNSNKYIGSFIGFVPADKPRLAILVLIDEPAGPHLGGVIAAPAFREVARQALLQMEIPPSTAKVEQVKPENKS